jgi:hypothetical protein
MLTGKVLAINYLKRRNMIYNTSLLKDSYSETDSRSESDAPTVRSLMNSGMEWKGSGRKRVAA